MIFDCLHVFLRLTSNPYNSNSLSPLGGLQYSYICSKMIPFDFKRSESDYSKVRWIYAICKMVREKRVDDGKGIHVRSSKEVHFH